MAVAVELTCSGCRAAVDKHEGDLCAFCRMAERGDGQLLAHDDRGWLLRITKMRGRVSELRTPCRCGCGQAAPQVQEPEPERAPTIVPPRASLHRIRSEEELLDMIRQWVADFGQPPSIKQWKAKRRERGLPSWTVISARFGTWNGAIRAAGFEPYLGGRRHGGWKPKPIPGAKRDG